MNEQKYICPICNKNDLILRHEANYVYSYVIDSDAPGLKNTQELLSYQYDKREQRYHRDYVECTTCGTQYPYQFLFGILEQDNIR
ncbi:MAG: hypothetical protein K0R00_2888 [Herbinix sp.]|jgi:hypothetical protein|nr:hypothetical protein [Herbinix sp.]